LTVATAYKKEGKKKQTNEKTNKQKKRWNWASTPNDSITIQAGKAAHDSIISSNEIFRIEICPAQMIDNSGCWPQLKHSKLLVCAGDG